MKCKVCGKKLNIQADRRYGICKPVPPYSVEVFECFDCEYCGCQNILNIREIGPALIKQLDIEGYLRDAMEDATNDN